MTAQTVVNKFVSLGGSEIEFDYKKQISIIRGAIATLNKQLITLVEQHRSICEHLEWDHRERYASGGYDYSAYTNHYFTCKECGESRHEREDHNSSFE